MPTTLEQILATTRAGLSALQPQRRDLERRAAAAPVRQALLGGWDRSRLALVAEVKRRSPSAGTISAALDPVAHARTYAAAGASAISVLTDGPFFGGSLLDLEQVAAAVTVPLLRKDFILDEVQVLEARAAGASAVLLIVRALPLPRLRQLLAFSRDLGLEALVEAHDAAELALALETDARYLGVNSRNLDSFAIDVDAAWSLLSRIPADRVAIAESGMTSEADVRKAADAGADGVLIGTALSGAIDPSGLARAVSSLSRTGR